MFVKTMTEGLTKKSVADKRRFPSGPLGGGPIKHGQVLHDMYLTFTFFVQS